MEPLPTFRYHPDPIASGSIEESEVECLCCGRARGYIYTGPTYAEEDLDESLCPWCIADGSAAEKFEAQFVDEENFDDDIPDKVVEEVTERTPSYSGWQQEVWPTCCDDATAFITPVGFAEIRRDHKSIKIPVFRIEQIFLECRAKIYPALG